MHHDRRVGAVRHDHFTLADTPRRIIAVAAAIALSMTSTSAAIAQAPADTARNTPRVVNGGSSRPARPEHDATPAFSPAIADNSLLIEEAYNQEAGVVQHINTLMRTGARVHDYAYSFTQEWPFHGQANQLSYTIPYAVLGGHAGHGFGDVMLNYRRQLGGLPSSVAVAPRVSAVLPVGRSASGLGSGALGVQLNLPVSAQLSDAVATHWNAGATWTPRAAGPTEAAGRHSLTSYNLGASIIAPVDRPINLLVEYLVTSTATIGDDGSVAHEHATTVNPGVRFAFPLRGAQIVPGFAVPIDLAGGERTHGAFFYLSVEHAFRTLEENTR